MKDTVLQNRIYRHKQTARNILGNTEAVLGTAAAMESCGSRGGLPNTEKIRTIRLKAVSPHAI